MQSCNESLLKAFETGKLFFLLKLLNVHEGLHKERFWGVIIQQHYLGKHLGLEVSSNYAAPRL